METLALGRKPAHYGNGLLESPGRLQGAAVMAKVDISFRKMAVLLGIIAGVLTAIMTILNVTSSAEPYWLAHREFVREQITRASLKMANDVGKVESRQISTQLQMAKATRRDIQGKIEDKQILLTQNATLPQAVRDAINDQIRSLKEEYEDISSTISDLTREQSGRRP